MLDITEDPIRDQKIKLGDDAEDAVVAVIQKTGTKFLEEWAQKRSEQAAEEVSQKPKHRFHEKKVTWHTSLGLIEIFERCFLREGRYNQVHE